MQRILGVELCHQTAPLHVREKISLDKEQTFQALTELKSSLGEVFLVSTCNRLAVYSYASEHKTVLDFFNRFGNINLYLNVFDHDESAIQNLFSTAAGLKSQVIGEHEILGQVRQSYHAAQSAGALGTVMHEFARRAIQTGKRVRGETSIGQYSTSLASVSLEVIHEFYPSLKNASVLVIGTGEMATLVLQLLEKEEAGNVFIASKNIERAEHAAKVYGGTAVATENISQVFPKADIIIGATATNQFVLSASDMQGFSNDSKKLLIDLGVPRNFDPALEQLPFVRLKDLDRIKELTYQGMLKRQKEIPKAQEIVNEEVEEFVFWLNAKKIHPLISSFNQQIEEIKKKELAWALPKMGELEPHQLKILEKYTNRLISHLSQRPINTLKSYAQAPQKKSRPIETFKEIYNLEDVHIHIPNRKIVIGSRESKLAMAQTHEVLERLKKMEPDYEFVIKGIKTRGDLGFVDELGAFVKEVEIALLNGEVDMAVHSLKDLPTEIPRGLTIAAIPERADSRDLLITATGKKLQHLPEGATVGTSSMRRAFQINDLRKDLKILPIRGNIFTRMSKLESGEFDAIVLAAAGLQRMGILNRATEIFSYDQMIPAVGQGALAVETRSDDDKLIELISRINHEPTFHATLAERELLTALGGGCRLPIGAIGKVKGDDITLHGIYCSSDGSIINRGTESGKVTEAVEIGRRLAEKLSKF